MPYTFKVRALNEHGAGAWSEETSQAAWHLPSAPTEVVVTPQDSAIQLTWAAPDDVGSPPFNKYVLSWARAQGGLTTVSIDAGVTSYTISDLPNFDLTRITLVPWSTLNRGERDSYVYWLSMAQGAPPPLENVRVTKNDQGLLVVNWKPLVREGPVNSANGQVNEAWKTNWVNIAYTNFPGVDGTTGRVPATDGQYVLTQLDKKVSYLLIVVPVNHAGEGLWVAIPGMHMPSGGSARVPAAPLVSLDKQTANSVTVSWRPPSDAGSTPIIKYNVRYCRSLPVVGTCHYDWLHSTSTCYTFNLDMSKPFDFQVSAVNTAGLSPWSASVKNKVTAASSP